MDGNRVSIRSAATFSCGPNLAWIEPCGNTHVEAMASGLPTLGTYNGGVSEAVRASNGGIVSNADKSYEYTYVDSRNPPKPKYEVLLEIEHFY